MQHYSAWFDAAGLRAFFCSSPLVASRDSAANAADLCVAATWIFALLGARGSSPTFAAFSLLYLRSWRQRIASTLTWRCVCLCAREKAPLLFPSTRRGSRRFPGPVCLVLVLYSLVLSVADHHAVCHLPTPPCLNSCCGTALGASPQRGRTGLSSTCCSAASIPASGAVGDVLTASRSTAAQLRVTCRLPCASPGSIHSPLRRYWNGDVGITVRHSGNLRQPVLRVGTRL